MENLKFKVSSIDEQSEVYSLLEKLGYDALWYKKSSSHKFIFADKNGEIGIGTSKNEKDYNSSEHKETTLEELILMVLYLDSKL